MSHWSGCFKKSENQLKIREINRKRQTSLAQASAALITPHHVASVQQQAARDRGHALVEDVLRTISGQWRRREPELSEGFLVRDSHVFKRPLLTHPY